MSINCFFPFILEGNLAVLATEFKAGSTIINFTESEVNLLLPGIVTIEQ